MLMRTSSGLQNNSHGWSILRRWLPPDVQEACKGLTLCADGFSAVFDAPNNAVQRILAAAPRNPGTTFAKATELPELCFKDYDYEQVAWEIREMKNRITRHQASSTTDATTLNEIIASLKRELASKPDLAAVMDLRSELDARLGTSSLGPPSDRSLGPATRNKYCRA